MSHKRSETHVTAAARQSEVGLASLQAILTSLLVVGGFLVVGQLYVTPAALSALAALGVTLGLNR